MTHPAKNLTQPIILFDGVCGLCNRWVQFVLRHDRDGRFLFCAVQSASGQQILQHFDYSTDVYDTLLLVEGSKCAERSEAVLAIMSRLGWPWRAAAALNCLPRAWLNAGYDWVAQHRYRWFGRREYCAIPSPRHRERFIE